MSNTQVEALRDPEARRKLSDDKKVSALVEKVDLGDQDLRQNGGTIGTIALTITLMVLCFTR